MNRLRNIHPGELLEEEFLEPFEITAYRLAREINIATYEKYQGKELVRNYNLRERMITGNGKYSVVI